eukprot:g6091.t1
MASLVSDLIRTANGRGNNDKNNDNDNSWKQGQPVVDLTFGTDVSFDKTVQISQQKNDKSQQPTELVCNHCTYKNLPSANRCNMCNNILKPSAPHNVTTSKTGFQVANVIDLGYDSSDSDNVMASEINNNSDRNKCQTNACELHVHRTVSMELAYEMGIDKKTARFFLDEQRQFEQQSEQQTTTTINTIDTNTDEVTVTHTIKVNDVNKSHARKSMFGDYNTNRIEEVKPTMQRMDSDEVAQTLNIPIEEARNIIKQQASMDFEHQRQKEQSRRDSEMASKLAMVVEKDCLCCLNTFSVEQMYTIDCKSSHRVCFECIKRSVEPAFSQKKLPRCPFGSECGHTLSLLEVIQIFGKNSKFHILYEELEVQNTLASDTKSFLPCPRPNCKDYCFADRPGSKEKAICPTCKFEFCSLCKDKYHYHLSCGELGPTAERWFKWINEDCAKFRGEYGKALKAMEALKHAEEQFKNLQQDETWKEQHCRLCPHCRKVVYRVDGCNSMTCGRDAADKGGGNKQDGCGKKFNWNQAKKYKRGADKAHLPKGLEQVDMELAKEIFHYLIRPENLKAGEQIETYRRPCDNCKKAIKGPRFACIHCPHQLNICIDCQVKLTDGNTTIPCHTQDHIFQIFFEPSYPEVGTHPPLMEETGGGWINLINQQFTESSVYKSLVG